MDSSVNQSAFFQNKNERALAAFEHNNTHFADNLCQELTDDFVCPRLIQVHALQLQSFCTRNYWHARAFLLRRFAVLAEVTELYPDMEATDEPITTLSDNTRVMLDDLDDKWQQMWQGRGKPAPTEAPSTTTANEGDGDELELGVGGLAINAGEK